MRKSIKILCAAVLICAMMCIFAINIFAFDATVDSKMVTIDAYYQHTDLYGIWQEEGVLRLDRSLFYPNTSSIYWSLGDSLSFVVIASDGDYYETYSTVGHVTAGHVVNLEFDSFLATRFEIYWLEGPYNYQAGYADGQSAELNADVNINRTFWQIVSSPFIFLQNMLNFEFFGINLFALVTSILTLILVAFIFKKIYRGL